MEGSEDPYTGNLPPGQGPPGEEEEEEYARPHLWVLRVVAVVAILGLIGVFVARPATEADRFPRFDLPLLEGQGTLDSRTLRGRPVVINYWASWCEPCREEAPHLEAIWQSYRDRGLVVVGVNVQDQATHAREFVEEQDLTFPMVTDHGGELSGRLGLYGLPQTYFVDREWRFHGQSADAPGEETGRGGTTVLGAISAEELERNVREMLEDDS